MKHWTYIFLSGLLGFSTARMAGSAEPTLKLVAVHRLWNQDPHNAFTDLAVRGDQWLCVFRVGSGHVSPDGVIQLLSSHDGRQWVPVGRMAMNGADLRDPKLCVTSTGAWMLTAAAAFPGGGAMRHQTFAWFSEDGRSWGPAVAIGEPNWWLWRVTWHEGFAYAVAYRTTQERSTRLYRSRDGTYFEVWVPDLFSEGYANEHALGILDDGRMLCLLRRDPDGGDSSGSARLGTAAPPYREWAWKDLGTRIGGPAMIHIPGKGWLVAIRSHTADPRTALAWLDPSEGLLKPALDLPSGGDTSYPGMVRREDRLWVSYYASHEGRSSIYLAEVALE